MLCSIPYSMRVSTRKSSSSGLNESIYLLDDNNFDVEICVELLNSDLV